MMSSLASRVNETTLPPAQSCRDSVPSIEEDSLFRALAVQANSLDDLRTSWQDYAELTQRFSESRAEFLDDTTAAAKMQRIFDFLRGGQECIFTRQYIPLKDALKNALAGKGHLGDCANLAILATSLAGHAGVEYRLHMDLYHVFCSVSGDGHTWTPLDFAYGNNISQTEYECCGEQVRHRQSGRTCRSLTQSQIDAVCLCRFAMSRGCGSGTAKTDYLEASKKFPDWAEPYNNLGDLAWEEGDIERAMEFYYEAVEREGHNIFFRLNLAVCRVLLAATPDRTAMLKEADELLAIYPAFKEGQYFKLLMQGNVPQETLRVKWSEVEQEEHLMYATRMKEKLRELARWHSDLFELPCAELSGHVLQNDLYRTAALKENIHSPDEYLDLSTIRAEVFPYIAKYMRANNLEPCDTRVLIWGYGAALLLPSLLIDLNFQVSGVEHGGESASQESSSNYAKLEALFDERGVFHTFPDLHAFERFSHREARRPDFDVVIAVNPNPSLWAGDCTAGVLELTRWSKQGGLILLQIDGDYHEPDTIANKLYQRLCLDETLQILHEKTYPATSAPFPSLYKNYTGQGNAVLLLRKEVADP